MVEICLFHYKNTTGLVIIALLKKQKSGAARTGKKRHPKKVTKLLRKNKSLWKAAKKSSVNGGQKRTQYKKCSKLLRRAKISNVSYSKV